MLLKHVKSDSGRARSWLRSALNEHSLERYFHMMITDEKKISQYYQPHAFMLDQERSSMLPQMSAGLNSILFAIIIDNESLNSFKNGVLLDRDAEILAAKVVSKPASKVKCSPMIKR